MPDDGLVWGGTGMSSTLIYDAAAWVVPAAEAGTAEDQYVVAALEGASNTCTQAGARVRKWHLLFLGSYNDVLRDACKRAGSCEGGMLQDAGKRWLKPETYIARIRRLMHKASHISGNRNGQWFGKTFKVDIPTDQIDGIRQTNPDVIDRLMNYDMPHERKEWYSNVVWSEWKFPIAPDAIKLFFSVLPHFKDDHRPWSLAEISGPGEK
jgi:hypothetical protein